jgi:hypothetical protein
MIQPLAVLPILRSYRNQQQLMHRVLYSLRQRKNLNKENTVTRQQYLDYFKFTIVRNPWSRAVSAYMNVMRGERHQRKLGVSEDTTLANFLVKYAGKRILRSQMEWITDFCGCIPMDFIGRFENLEEDFKIITSTLGCGPVDLPGRSAKLARAKPWEMAEEVSDLIERIYKREIEHFGFERPDSGHVADLRLHG